MSLEHLDTLISFVAILTGVSLIVTTLTQAVSALVGLRGRNLLWGVQTLLVNVDPALEPHAEAIAAKILQHPLVSDSTLSNRTQNLFGRWKLASAIRKDELIDIVRRLAKLAEGETTAVEPWKLALRTSLDRLLPAEGEKLLVALPEIKKIFPDDPAKVELVMAQLIPTAERLTVELDDWFHSVMDRVSQRFAMHARTWTIIFSVVVAFALQLDAFDLFRGLSTNPELRARVLASADALTRKADEILTVGGSAGSAVYVLAMKQLIEAHPVELKALPEPGGFSTEEGAQQWLTAQLHAIGTNEIEKWSKAFEAQVPQASLRSAASNLDDALKHQLSFQLLPDPYPSPFFRDWIPTARPFWGMLASAALLSLGAPFWFNLLKTMSNLRPVVANKEKEERTKDETGQSA